MQFNNQFHGTPGISDRTARTAHMRDSTRHLDAKDLAARITEFLQANPRWNPHRLSLAAGLCATYAGKVLRGEMVEVQSGKGLRLLTAMRRIEKENRA